MSLSKFALIVSILNLVCYNIPFFGFVHEKIEGETLGVLCFMACLVVVMIALNFMATYLLLFLTRSIGRVLQALLLFINAVAVHFVFTYNVLMDESMIGNVFNTRYSEASGFFSWSLVAFVFVAGVLPAFFVLVQPLVYGTWRRFCISCGSSLGLSLVLALLNLNQTLWIGKYDTELGGLIMPWGYIVNTGRLYTHKTRQEAKEILLPDATFRDQKKTAVVLVIGESARKADFQLYGYARPTNPLLSQQEGLKVLQAQSCATYTTAGVKSILEYKETDDLYEILPNYAFRTGADVVWRTSNWGEPPVHVDYYEKESDITPSSPDVDASFDEILFDGIRQRIEGSDKSKVLIVLHTSTSHGPNYIAKYPESFKRFEPVFDNVDQAHKDNEKLINAYDNSIVYTDYLLSNLIDTLRAMPDWQTAMLFVSDHGESLGENGLYMHGLPKNIAPAEQYEIPFLLWLSSDFRQLKPVGGSGKALPALIDQHYVFHSVLNLLSIDSPVYNADLDLFLPR